MSRKIGYVLTIEVSIILAEASVDITVRFVESVVVVGRVVVGVVVEVIVGET